MGLHNMFSLVRILPAWKTSFRPVFVVAGYEAAELRIRVTGPRCAELRDDLLVSYVLNLL
jgi:hypothetical protein